MNGNHSANFCIMIKKKNPYQMIRKLMEIPWSKSEEPGFKIPHSQLSSSAAVLFESNLLPSKPDILRSRCI